MFFQSEVLIFAIIIFLQTIDLIQHFIKISRRGKMNLAQLIRRKNSRSAQRRNKDHIFLRLHNGNGCEINFEPNDTLEDLLKMNLNSQFELPTTFEILFQGRQVTNFQLTAQEIGLQNQSILHIKIPSHEGLKLLSADIGIYYKTDRIYIRMKAEETLGILKKKIEKVLQVKVENQRLFFRGEQLQDDKVITFYELKNDSLICLLERIKRPGHNPFSKKPHYIQRGVSDINRYNLNYEIGSPKKVQFRSFRMNVPEKDLGIEIEIKTKDIENEEENYFGMNQPDFEFNFLSPQDKAIELSEGNIRSTRSEDDSDHKQSSPARTDSLDSFNDSREMII